MKNTKINIPIILMSTFVLLLLLAVFLPPFFFSPEEEKVVRIENRSEWRTYENDEFGFSIEYPPDWRVEEFPEHELVPKFHILPQDEKDVDVERMTHHTDVHSVSIFPQGYPTEGIFGESGSSNVNFGEEINEATDYYLLNGDVWGTMLKPESEKEKWNEHGFVWGVLPVKEHETVCFKDGEEISKDRCDPVSGHEIKHSGSVKEQDRLIQKEILRSFEFKE
ncbi:MAG: hypothetical protein ACQEP6_01380 [Patescibacteria group bacterium]